MKYILVLIYLSASGNPAMVVAADNFRTDTDCQMSGRIASYSEKRNIVDFICLPGPVGR